MLYLTEVSHLTGGKAYCFGGGFYIDPIFPPYDVKAIVTDAPTTAASALRSVEVPPPSAIDYYAMIDASGPRPAAGRRHRGLRLPRPGLRHPRLCRRRLRHRRRRAEWSRASRTASASREAWPA